MSDAEFDDLVAEARDPSNPVGLDYEHAQLSAAANRPDARKITATDALVRTVRSSKSSAPADRPEDRKKAAAANALRHIVGRS